MSVNVTVGSDGVVQELEGKTREYKRDLSSPPKVMRALVAFANSAGGQLVVGVNDDLQIVGVADPLAEEERLASLIADSIEPRLMPTIEIVTAAGKALLVARVALSGRRPHYIKTEGPDEGVYLRLGSTNRQADLPMIQELKRTALGKTFDQLPAEGQTLDSLDTEVLAGMLGRPVDDETLRTLTLAVPDGDGTLIPTNGGMLMAGKRREELFPFAWIQCGRFRGDDKVDIFDQAEIHSHLPLAVDEAVKFLTKNAFKSAEFGEVRRKDTWSIPVDAIREIIINAVAHASWGAAATPIRVAFMDERIEIESPGGLMPGMTVEDMISGVSQIRNPVIVRLFRELHLMEEWGSGVKRVIAALAAEGLGTPQFIELPGRLRVIIPISRQQPRSEDDRPSEVHREDDREDDREVHREDDRPSEVHREVHREDDVWLTERALALLHAAEHPTHRDDLLAALGLGTSYGNYKRHIAPLVEQGLLALTIPETPTSKNQRYRITPRGREALRQAPDPSTHPA